MSVPKKMIGNIWGPAAQSPHHSETNLRGCTGGKEQNKIDLERFVKANSF